MDHTKIGSCAIALCLLFGFLTVLSFLYLYQMNAKLREEHIVLKNKSVDFLRADQVPAMIETSDALRVLRESQREQRASQLEHRQTISDFEKQLNELVTLGQKQQRLFQAIQQQQQQQQAAEAREAIQLSSSDEDEKKEPPNNEETLQPPPPLSQPITEESAASRPKRHARPKKTTRFSPLYETFDVEKQEAELNRKLTKRAKEEFRRSSK